MEYSRLSFGKDCCKNEIVDIRIIFDLHDKNKEKKSQKNITNF